MDIYTNCPTTHTEHFTLRLLRAEDAADLFLCYHDREAVARMNDDNCDAGFYADTPDAMAGTVNYWLKHYGWRDFVRFSIVERATGAVIGTVEGFGGVTGVLRLDIASAYEEADLLAELLTFAQQNFRAWFGNERLVIKAIPAADARRAALTQCGWRFLGEFRMYSDYYGIDL